MQGEILFLLQLPVADIVVVKQLVDEREVPDFEVELQKLLLQLLACLPELCLHSPVPRGVAVSLVFQDLRDLLLHFIDGLRDLIRIVKDPAVAVRAPLRGSPAVSEFPSFFRLRPLRAFTLQDEKFPDRLRELFLQFRPDVLDLLPEREPLRPVQLRGVHVPAAVHEVVRLVDEENGVGRDIPVPEKSPQIDVGIKDVVVVADDHVREETHVERELERTDLMLLRAGQNCLSGVVVRLGQ